MLHVYENIGKFERVFYFSNFIGLHRRGTATLRHRASSKRSQVPDLCICAEAMEVLLHVSVITKCLLKWFKHLSNILLQYAIICDRLYLR
jgi:hypothetical protein